MIDDDALRIEEELPDQPPRGARRRAREMALQTLYAIDLSQARVEAAPPREVRGPRETFDGVAAHFESPHAARDFAWELTSEVRRHAAELDERIGARARNWRVPRMATVDRNILRLGAYELAHTDTPTAVVLDEAVELARRFGSDASPAFVNGILDALAHEFRGDEL